MFLKILKIVFKKDGTAQAIAMHRLVETLENKNKRVIYDYFASNFVVGGSIIKLMGHKFNIWILKKIIPGLHEHLIARTKYLDDVIERIKISINSQDGGSNLFINEKSLALSSIYNFLYEFLNTKEINEEYLKFYDNEYITNSLKIDHKNINLSSIPDELINMLSI